MLNEIEGKGKPNGPLIFEIPLDYSDKLDILSFGMNGRILFGGIESSLILEAYGNNQGKIAQALGLLIRRPLSKISSPMWLCQ